MKNIGLHLLLLAATVFHTFAQNENKNKPAISFTIFNENFGDTSLKCPDAGWISEERLAQNPVENEDDNFLKIAPDFIVEIKSQSDSLKKLKKKMSDTWIKNGVKLAWLIDPYKQKAYIYRKGKTKPEEVKGFDDTFLDGEDVVKGFKLPLEKFKIINGKR